METLYGSLPPMGLPHIHSLALQVFTSPGRYLFPRFGLEVSEKALVLG
jgi:hypothetical protein